MEQLAKLGQLRDAGVLTDDEFAAKKVEILARM
ncbi:SHOCT domain-containing protein [Rhodococcus spelaei]|uniref:SHOCT domain-containing protein n=2 Tax=Rhodococcus spelaei TaxID=2546320 RepID=A0A541B2H4_9NOCA|nr:SHOCT domain-containing protein [Rhodococcus spelaei]